MNLTKSILSGSIAALALAASAQAGFVEVSSNITTDTRWTRDNVYILRTVVYVLPPAKLIIEPGTIIRGVKEGSGFDTADPQSPGALITARGAKIIANGTPDDPIVFTSIDDPHVIGGASTIPATVNGNPVLPQNYAPDGPTNANAFAYDGQWGGLVLLGEGPLGYDGDGDSSQLQYTPNPGDDTGVFSGDTLHYPTGANSPLASAPFNFDVKDGDGVGVAVIEGANVSTISGVTYTEPLPGADNEPPSGSIIPAVYGGLNEADNSGVLSFISSRYGGFVLGAANELNGISFGGTGKGTVVEWCESFNNADDGFEFFGGYTNFRYLFSLYHGDDGLDGDNGFNGTIQHAFVVSDDSTGARSGFPTNNTSTGRIAANNSEHCSEWDGSVATDESGNLVTPNTVPFVYNFTLIPGAASGRDAMRNRRGTGGAWFNGLIQNCVDDAWRPGEGANASLTQNFMVYSSVADTATELGVNKYSSATATALSLELVAANRITFQGLDPRAASGATSADRTKFNTPPNRTDAFPYSRWTKAPWAGAMRDNNMLKSWSVLDYVNILAPTNIARPAVTIGTSGSNATVSFASAAGVGGRAAFYVVERSTNRAVWTPFATVSDNNTAGTTDFSGTTFATNDGNATVGQITVTDPTSLVAGTPVYYRVIPQ
jgi:hypothetical protein